MKKLLSYLPILLIVFSLGLSSASALNPPLGQSEKGKSAQSKSASANKPKDGQVAAPPQTISSPLAVSNPVAKGKRRTIAVLDFGDASLTDLKKNLGRQLAILLSNAFTKQGDFIVVERLQLDRVTNQVNKEEDTDRYKENPLVRIGKLLKADALILGDITEFTATKKGKNFGIASKSSYTAKLGLAVRLVDISSGEVLDAVNLEETAEEKGESNPFWQKGAQLDEDLKVTLFTKAANQAVDKTVNQLNKLIQEKIHAAPATEKARETAASVSPSSLAPASKPATAVTASSSRPKIVKLEGNVATINIGKLQGTVLGSTFVVVREEITTDPDTKEVLDRKETEIGRIKITEVRDGVSIGSLTPGSRGVKMRDLVKSLESANP
ncbi:MAG TPA: CsgG/HfaB family protein [Pyrinomonadaceae bacterium]|jgi:curli biogenesis system outer membrane secretion channel CsgG